jgi:hypothetical protein
VVNWRDALDRMRHARVDAVLMGMVDQMRPGQRIMLVVPVDLATTPLWLKLINVDAVRWTRALERDRSLRAIATSDKGAPGSGTGIRATVFVVSPGPHLIHG